MPLCWPISDTAARLNISVQTVRKLVRQRRLARVPGLRKILVTETSLVQFAGTAS